MKRIYLDQWAWVALAKAATGHSQGRRFEDVLLLAREAVRQGHVSFPLFNTHYIETSHKRAHDKRMQLATVMAELSRFHTIAPQRVIIPAEVDSAVRATFDIPGRPKVAQVFGLGLGHAFDTDLGTYHVPEEMGLTPGQARVVETQAQPIMEFALLAGPPDHVMDGVEGYDPDAHRAVPAKFAVSQEEHRQRMLEGDWHKGDKGRRVALANAFSNYYGPIDSGLRRHQLSWDDLLGLGIERVTAFVEAMPTGWADTQLQRLRNEASQGPWEPNDLNDLDALARAIVYCDVVVTEKQWVSFIKRADLDARNHTLAMSNLTELLVPLIEASSG